MAGMYPDNQTLEIFGETLSWPNVDENGKFTNGSFSDPEKKPSFIPAETVNLVLDNIGNLIKDMGLNPNDTDPKQLEKAVRHRIYTKKEIDDKQSALINMTYKSGYWWGRRNSATTWPKPGVNDTWPANSKKSFDFSTNTIWVWDGLQWVAGETLPVANGTTIGISVEFLDISDSGYPGKAIYRGEKESWDFYPDMYNEEVIKRAVIMPGIIEPAFTSDESLMAQFRRMPFDGRCISVQDSRAERLLQYFLIPHAEAVANPDIIGMYLTNEYYADHAAWLAANKLRPTPAENGIYLFIPDGSGLFIRGAGKHGGHKAADNTPYDGNSIGSFESFGGVGIPYYAARQTLAEHGPTTAEYKWTATKDGFFQVSIDIVPNLAGIIIKINNVFVVNHDYNGNGGPRALTPLFQVKAGDVVTIGGNNSNYKVTTYFVPPINDRGSISALYLITY
jgi:hypothetical protein